METKTYIRRLISRTLIFITIMFIVSIGLEGMTPVINNDIAMTQMENSNASLILMESYERFKPLMNIAKILIVTWFGVTVTHDTYKLIKGLETNERP